MQSIYRLLERVADKNHERLRNGQNPEVHIRSYNASKHCNLDKERKLICVTAHKQKESFYAECCF